MLRLGSPPRASREGDSHKERVRTGYRERSTSLLISHVRYHSEMRTAKDEKRSESRLGGSAPSHDLTERSLVCCFNYDAPSFLAQLWSGAKWH